MADLEHEEIQKLREENRHLMRKIAEQSENAENSPPSDAATVDRLRADNLELREALLRYRSLEEELSIQRIFETSKKRMMAWLTFGGSVATIASVIGIILGAPGIKEHLRQQADAQINKVTGGQVDKLVAERIKAAVDPQLADLRADFEKKANETIRLASLPDATKQSTDYTESMPAARDEGQEGSTAAFAITAAMEYQIQKQLGKTILLSPRWLYYQARKLAGTSTFDSGATLADALNATVNIGVIPEDAWPYKAGEYAAAPPSAAESAPRYKVLASKRLTGLREIKAALQSFGPVIAGVSLYKSAWADEVKRTGRIPVPGPSDSLMGGHALCIVGFDDRQRLLKFQNMWGTAWGDHGYGYLPYEYVERNLSEFWAIVL